MDNDLWIADLDSFARGRLRDVARGAETPALAALMTEKYGLGLAQAAALIGERALANALVADLDRLVAAIDPQFLCNRQRRWAARPAGLSFGETDGTGSAGVAQDGSENA